MSLGGAFNLLLSLKARTMTLTRPGAIPQTVTIKVSPSNYGRKLETVSDTVIYGNEFILSKEVLDLVFFPRPKRGDRLVDTVMGTMTINEVNEMFDIGGDILGYRVRVG